MSGVAAGHALDRTDVSLGAPRHTPVVARAVVQEASYQPVNEGGRDQTTPGSPKDLICLDITLFEMPQGGAIFAVGGMNLIGALPVSERSEALRAKANANGWKAAAAIAELEGQIVGFVRAAGEADRKAVAAEAMAAAAEREGECLREQLVTMTAALAAAAKPRRAGSGKEPAPESCDPRDDCRPRYPPAWRVVPMARSS
ncbi:hypothetical protein [Roseomonas rosulenta]|uniref:hypothetical protein n=1 Tax=Roseomonas rosulenta TaxID=2748667 RepID=UPI0018DEF0B2|nr:hypothetical protein [Roseomonas rosulenta]